MDQLPRLGKRELICLLLFTCNYVVSVWRGFPFLWALGMSYVILLRHSLSLPYILFTFLVMHPLMNSCDLLILIAENIEKIQRSMGLRVRVPVIIAITRIFFMLMVAEFLSH